MDRSLTGVLASLELDAFTSRLEELGVRQCADVTFLNDEDLKQAGLNLIQVRKLQLQIRQWLEDNRAEQQQATPEPSRERKAEEWPWLSRCPRHFTSFGSDHSDHSGPRRLIFIRHGESEANVNRKITATVPDHNLHLTERGRQQATDAGHRLKALVGDGTLRFTCSPYVRTRETLNGMLRAWAPDSWPCHEDVRLREQEFGNYDPPDIKDQHKEKSDFGPFFYRFSDGESPADCYDRAHSFLESLRRSFQVETAENHVIVGHGTMLVVMLICLFQKNVSIFDSSRSLENAELVVCERAEDGQFEISYTWAPGEEKKPCDIFRSEGPAEMEIWNGDPNSRMLSHDVGNATA